MDQQRILPDIVPDGTATDLWYRGRLLQFYCMWRGGWKVSSAHLFSLVGVYSSLCQRNCRHDSVRSFWPHTGDCGYMWEIQPMAPRRRKCCNSQSGQRVGGWKHSALPFAASSSPRPSRPSVPIPVSSPSCGLQPTIHDGTHYRPGHLLGLIPRLPVSSVVLVWVRSSSPFQEAFV